MGLDQYTYLISKLSDDDIEEICGMSVNKIEYDYPSYRIFYVDDYDKYDRSLIEDVAPYIQYTKAYRRVFNEDVFKKDYEIPQDAKLIGLGYRDGDIHMTYECRDKNYRKEFYIDSNKYNSYYSLNPSDIGVCDSVDIEYWRKNWDFQDELSKYVNIENCKYTLLNEEALEIVKGYSQDPKQYDIYNSLDSNKFGIFYWPWW